MNVLTLNNARQQFPLRPQDLPAITRKDNVTQVFDSTTLHSFRVGPTKFSMYCDNYIPQGVIEHAAAAIHICHQLLWKCPEERDKKCCIFELSGGIQYKVIPMKEMKIVEVTMYEPDFLCVQLPNPKYWHDQNLAWMLRRPDSDDTELFIEYLIANPIREYEESVGMYGPFPSWSKAIARAQLALV
jgi:hypothetical protein